MNMDSSSSSMSRGVLLPNYPLASGDFLRAIEQLGLVSPMSTDDDGEYRNLHRTGPGHGMECRNIDIRGQDSHTIS